MAKKKYKISGMSCAACSARVEKAASSVKGVEKCEVNLLLGTMSIVGEASESDIIEAVSAAGYGAEPEGAAKDSSETDADAEHAKERKSIVKRIVASSVLLLGLMYLSMGHVMWSFPLPAALRENPLAIALAELIISALIIVINKDFYLNGARGIVNLAPNMDTLVSLGSFVSFAYSVYLVFIMTDRAVGGDIAGAHSLLHSLYFESAAMILVLISVGKLLESIAKGKTTSAIRSLMDLAPGRARVLRDGKEIELAAKDILVGDTVVVRRGDRIAIDGRIIKGEISVDESALTGEGIPRDMTVGSKVLGATTVLSGYAEIEANAVGEEVAFAEIIRTVKEASGSKAPVAKAADKISGIFVPAVMAISLITLVCWLIARADIGFAIARAVSVLVISCPCALGLATPVAVMVGSGVGARHGILFKNAEALELSGKIKTVAIDKTGTVTEGKPIVSEVIGISVSSENLLAAAASAESKNEHPLARAITDYAEKKSISLLPVGEYSAEIGGIRATVDGSEIFGGNRAYIERSVGLSLDADHLAVFEKLSAEGKTALIFATSDSLLGIIALSDKIKEDSREAIERLNALGIKTVMITGDNKQSAEYVATRVGISEVYAGVMPTEKAEIIDKLKKDSLTAMIGDGINDAVALTKSDLGIAIGRGADVALESADVVLTGSGLSSAVDAVRLGRKTLVNVYENLFWAFIYNVIGIPLAAGAFISLFGWELNPMFGAAAMSLSSFLVVTNALRLNFFKSSFKKSNMQTIINNIGEKAEMKTITIKIEGMMCPHCSGRVKNALESNPAVLSADVSHERGDAVVTLKEELGRDVLESIVTEAGYKVIG